MVVVAVLVRRNAVVAYLATFLPAVEGFDLEVVNNSGVSSPFGISVSSHFVYWLITVTAIKMIAGVTVGHGQEVGEGMTIPAWFFLVAIFFLSSHPLTGL
ncbi:hypothetical protein M405DRAFT_858108 [Rhizopogon salebrosus TDB-379]|nr:hypothetical protein M405DRAFT_858108 [Rhizopogon salebrosus TDB-379]